MSKFILKTFLAFLFWIFFFYKSYALDDGVYSGIFKITYAHGDSDSQKNDTGIFEFTIKDNKVIKLFAYDDPNWKYYGLRYNYKINPKTNELSGFSIGSDPTRGVSISFKINMKGVFVGKKFAGEGNVELTSPESFILEKFIFESVN